MERVSGFIVISGYDTRSETLTYLMERIRGICPEPPCHDTRSLDIRLPKPDKSPLVQVFTDNTWTYGRVIREIPGGHRSEVQYLHPIDGKTLTDVFENDNIRSRVTIFAWGTQSTGIVTGVVRDNTAYQVIYMSPTLEKRLDTVPKHFVTWRSNDHVPMKSPRKRRPTKRKEPY